MGKHPLGSNKVSPTLLSYKATEMVLKSGGFRLRLGWQWTETGPRLQKQGSTSGSCFMFLWHVLLEQLNKYTGR